MSWTHIEDSCPRARKDYVCELCGLVIPRGEAHRKRYGITEDGRMSFRMHEKCVELTAEWGQDEWDCHDFGEFRQLLVEAEENTRHEGEAE